MNKVLKISLISTFALIFVVLIFWGASLIYESDSAQTFIDKFGVFGILGIAFLSGLNMVVPIHAATFTPVFLASGFSLPVIILFLAIGTTVADIFGYVLGRLGKRAAKAKFPVVHKKIKTFIKEKKKFVIPGIFLYSAFVPLPNEVMLLPLGVMGIRLKKIIIPLLLGTIINQTIFALGFNTVFEIIF